MKKFQLSTYERRGVSAHKADVHRAIAKLDKGLFPGAFCKILPDILGGSKKHCNILHADTAGTKAGLAWLAWNQTGDIKLVENIAVDALVMNTDDVGCVGAVDRLLVNQTLGINKFIVPEEVVTAIIARAQKFCDMLAKQGIDCRFAGGETASVGDIVRTLDVGSSVAVRMKREDVIDASQMTTGDILVGFSSTGQAVWEDEPNAGGGANGYTNARHDLLYPFYRKFTEAYAPQMPEELVYRGKHRLADELPEDPSWTIASALLSPTRTYLPLIKRILEEVGRKRIHGIIHCSGGGQTKIKKFGWGNVYHKENLFPVPPIFRRIKKLSGLSWKEMYETFNMGHRLEMAVPYGEVASECIAISQSFGIDARVIGRVHANIQRDRNNVVINVGRGKPLIY